MTWAHPDLPVRVGAMSLHEAVTQSSGSTLVDAGLGALAARGSLARGGEMSISERQESWWRNEHL